MLADRGSVRIWSAAAVLAALCSGIGWYWPWLVPLNNGDAARLLIPMGVGDAYGWPTLPMQLPLSPEMQFTPWRSLNPVAALVQLLANGHRAIGLEHFYLPLLSGLYLWVYWAGAMRLSQRLPIWAQLGLLLLLANPWALALLFSLYEEALFVALLPWLTLAFIHYHSASPWALWLASLTKLQFAPWLLLLWRRRLWGHALMGLILVSAAASYVLRFSGGVDANPYNRWFNGIGYSLNHVSQWPERDFEARRAQAAQRCVRTPGNVPSANTSMAIDPLWCSSYWPTGVALPVAEQTHLRATLPDHFRQALQAKPSIFFTVVQESVITAFRADYRQRYLRSQHWPQWLDHSTAGRAPWGALALALVVAACIRSVLVRDWSGVWLLSLSILYPAYVVFGDGYYEFEKHLFPWLLWLALTSLSVAAQGRHQNPASQPPP